MAAASTMAKPEDKHYDDSHSIGQKLKLPIREVKEKLHNSSHLHDAKVHLIHQK